jgi:hypothetical protein
MRNRHSTKRFNVTRCRAWTAGLIASTLGVTAGVANAQTQGSGIVAVPTNATSDTPSPLTGQDVTGSTETKATPSQTSEADERIKRLEEKAAAQAARVDALEQQLTTVNEQLSSSEASAPSDERGLSAWGFMDVNFGKAFMDNKHALYSLNLPVASSFFMNGINLYVKGKLTPTLSALVETRLTFTPVGTVTSNPVDAYMGKTLVQSGGPFSRNDVAVRAPLTQALYQQNGLMIERAQVDWQPTDWFAVRLGRFLTPYGIWNEDHGSPVLLGADNPNLINWELVPTRQTGLELYGSRMLADSLTLDYAATLSNGRGPIDQYKDLDSNKALGVRLKLVYSTDDVTLRVGAYGYMGRYTDQQQRVFVQLRPDMTLDTSYSPAFGTNFVTTNAYDEHTVALDTLVRFKGFKVFGEYARRRVIYSAAPPVGDDDKLLTGVPYNVPLYYASYFGTAYYAMAAYEINTNSILAGTKVTPYVGYDAIEPNSVVHVENMKQYRFGLNVKPSPWVTTKLEVVRVVPDAAAVASKMWVVVGQLAVAF